MSAAADRDTDALYAGLRDRYATDDALYNGYRTQNYFLREQRMILDELEQRGGVVLDVACGSGIMLQPLVTPQRAVFGLDYNDHACHAAAQNGLRIVRGDAFSLPFADASVDQILSCQFFNQQTPDAVEQFVQEAARCLRPGGRLVLVWRNGAALVHRVAHAVLTLWDKLAHRPTFHNHNHSLANVCGYALASGLEMEREEVTFPQWNWRTVKTNGIRARVIGASNFAVYRR